MRRRDFIAGIAISTAMPLAARTQQSERVWHIGVLMNLAADDPEGQARLMGFLRGLQESGWADSRNAANRHSLGNGRWQHPQTCRGTGCARPRCHPGLRERSHEHIATDHPHRCRSYL